jgi:hypothetical protein
MKPSESTRPCALWFVLLGVILFLLSNLVYHKAFGADLFTGNQHWEKVELLTKLPRTDPLFGDTTNVRQSLLKDAYAWLQSIAEGRHYVDKLTLATTNSAYIYDLEPSGFVNEVLPMRVQAVRRLNTANVEALYSTSLDDLNKAFDQEASYPEIYSYDRNHVYFNAYCAVTCTHYVWSQRVASPDSVTMNVAAEQAGARMPVLSAFYRPILWLKTASLVREKEGNEVAAVNTGGITMALLSDLLQIEGMIENHKDIRILPRVLSE